MTTKEKIQSLELKNFTKFKHINLTFSEGINVFIGGNGTGKTHLLKVLYCVAKYFEKVPPTRHIELFRENFLPKEGNLARLRRQKSTEDLPSLKKTLIHVNSKRLSFKAWITESGVLGHALSDDVFQLITRHNLTFAPVFLPHKEHLINAPGFRSLYNSRQIP